MARDLDGLPVFMAASAFDPQYEQEMVGDRLHRY
jgi:hypothetical protein